jgi:hypothetical protein
MIGAAWSEAFYGETSARLLLAEPREAKPFTRQQTQTVSDLTA